MTEKAICVWAKGSTNPITRKNELPEPCQKKKCPQGIFRSAKEMLEFCKEAYPSLAEGTQVIERGDKLMEVQEGAKVNGNDRL